ncbi:hypothetical protein [Rhizobium binae]|uniref:Uncharacterized protein n=1 Tax=Rhizobium binae TaxID=1138190 RepID=A0ABV2MC76_9HYPH|nr:hypothetical protein [Rhizobium binae]
MRRALTKVRLIRMGGPQVRSIRHDSRRGCALVDPSDSVSIAAT